MSDSDDQSFRYEPLETIEEASKGTTPIPNSTPGEDTDEEEFVYPGTSAQAQDSHAEQVIQEPEPIANVSPVPEELQRIQHESPTLTEPTVSPRVSPSPDTSRVEHPQEILQPPPAPLVQKTHPSSVQLEALQTAAASGDLKLLQNLFKTALEAGDVESFSLANDASPRTGLTALHAAASRGYLNIVKWRM
ncbi:hypothetical protein K474DRAFT_538349 [Panus rudis PR-1116 ss-1]|nr:hypothetical protein K474DRAFT_538349 [Panus rudis PR-1116 ss-1]